MIPNPMAPPPQPPQFNYENPMESVQSVVRGELDRERQVRAHEDRQKYAQEAQSNFEDGKSRAYKSNPKLYKGIENFVENGIKMLYQRGALYKEDLRNEETWNNAARLVRLQRSEFGYLQPDTSQTMTPTHTEVPGTMTEEEVVPAELTPQEDPKKGKYVFTNKKYVDYEDKSRKLDYFWQWGDTDPYERARWENAFNYSVVRVDDNLFWPEGQAPNNEGCYNFRDALLMKIKIEDYKAKRKPEIEQSERATRAMLEGFGARVRADATRAGIPRGDIDKLVDEIVLEETRSGGQVKPLLQSKKLYPDT